MIAQNLLEGIAVLRGASTVRLIALGDVGEEGAGDHFVMPIASLKMAQERWSIAIYA